MEQRTYHEELIGARIKVRKSKNPCVEGMEGTVVDETKHMLIIETREGRKRLAKGQHSFEVNGRDVPGRSLEGRPEERIKRWTRNR